MSARLISFLRLTAQDHSYLLNGNAMKATHTQWIALACITLHPLAELVLTGGNKTTERVKTAQCRPLQNEPVGMYVHGPMDQGLSGY